MRVYDLESSIRNADLKSFQKYYNGEIHQEFTNDNLSMLELLFTESSNCGNRMQIAEYLIHQGIDVNEVDKFGSIQMTYSVTLLKLATEELEPLYKLLLEAGSDYKLKNKSGKSCLDYAEEYSWRSGLLDIIKEYEDGRN